MPMPRQSDDSGRSSPGFAETSVDVKATASTRTLASRWLPTYIIAVDAAALLLLLGTFPHMPTHVWGDLVVFVCVAVLAEFWMVRLQRQGDISLALTVSYAAAVLFGPCFGALTALGASLFADGLRRRGLAKTAFNAGQLALSSGLAGLTFEALHAGPGLSLTSDPLAYVAAGVVYLLANSALASWVIALHGRPFAHVWLRALREGGIFYVAEVPLGVLLANAYAQSPWTLLYFPLLILVFFTGFRLFAQLRTETDNALVVLANTIDKRDAYTFEHSVRVARYVA